ncbi:MAG: hypothetical protein ACKOQ4_01835 [Mycobacterium sp.]
MVAEDLPQGASHEAVRQAAADELAGKFKAVADRLTANGARPKRVSYGRGRAGSLLKLRSPKGFVLDAVAPQLLLPDGRLWHYHSRGVDDGIYYDASVDHPRSGHGSIPLGDARFSFLGAVVAKYNFGYLHRDDLDQGYELVALSGKTDPPSCVAADKAISEIVAGLG